MYDSLYHVTTPWYTEYEKTDKNEFFFYRHTKQRKRGRTLCCGMLIFIFEWINPKQWRRHSSWERLQTSLDCSPPRWWIQLKHPHMNTTQKHHSISKKSTSNDWEFEELHMIASEELNLIFEVFVLICMLTIDRRNAHVFPHQSLWRPNSLEKK